MKFKVGNRVKDEYFGEGTVVEIDTGYEKKSILVKFDKNRPMLHDANSGSLKGPYEKHSCWFYNEKEQKELKLIKVYTYEDLKKSPMGTKITFEKGNILVKTCEEKFENRIDVSQMSELPNLKDEYYGKITKIEEPTYKTVYEAKEEILDEAEKRYLRGVIRPYKTVKYINKSTYNGGKKATVTITVIDIDGDNWEIQLPPFETRNMYKNMEDDKEYTLEELGL